MRRCGATERWIMLGHNVSAEAGMLEMAEWMESIVPELPVQLIESGEPSGRRDKGVQQ